MLRLRSGTFLKPAHSSARAPAIFDPLRSIFRSVHASLTCSDQQSPQGHVWADTRRLTGEHAVLISVLKAVGSFLVYESQILKLYTERSFMNVQCFIII